MILSRITIFVIMFLVLVVSVSERDTGLISHAQREGPSILGSKQNESKMSTGELGPPSNGVSVNTKRYIDQLSNSSSTEIASFPINDLPSETTMNVLKGLSVLNLYKVLTSISVDDLSTLLQRLTPDQVNQILDKLPQNQKRDIQNRIAS